MSWHAYVDESYRPDRDVYVLGGCIARDQDWAKFSEEWQLHLNRFGRVSASGQRYFHMTEMTNRMEEVGFFYAVMKRHIPIYISARFNRSEFDRACRRIYIPGAAVEWENSYYWIAFRCLMDKFHLERSQLTPLIPEQEVVHFHLDHTSDRKLVDRHWLEYLLQRPDNIRELYSPLPKFEDDRRTLPLQAADLWAWWVREWSDNDSEDKIGKHGFDQFQVAKTGRRPRATCDISFSEEQFLPTLSRWASAQTKGRAVMILPPGICALEPKSFSTSSEINVY